MSTTNGVNGTNGANHAVDSYDIPKETERLFQAGILNNPLIQKHLPPEAEESSKAIRFSGTSLPSIPINWRFAESVAALKAYEATLVNVLLKRKYGVTAQTITIDTDHAQLFFMSPMLISLDPNGRNLGISIARFSPEARKEVEKYFPSWDKHRTGVSLHRQLATNIYPTRDGRYYHIHGSMNPDPTLTSLGLPLDADHADAAAGKRVFREALAQFSSAAEYDTVANDQYRQAGTIAWSVDEYRASEHGQANAHVGLFDIHPVPNPKQPASWWPESPQTGPRRPLAGLKVVELTRVIAGPAIGRGLAELGASVMRVTGPDITDLSVLHADLNAGKWNCHLDLKKEADRETLRELVREADVFLQGYRPHTLDKHGFGKDDVLALVEGRDRGIVYARENCYGWNGPWAGRTGWQQISDACCGVSLGFGKAMGLDEPVTPVFPNSDFCTGIAGTAGILTALMQRAESGGSYVVDVALNYYSRWLVDSVGMYPKEVWEDVYTRNGRRVFRCDDNMQMALLPGYLSMVKEHASEVLLKREFFVDAMQKNLGVELRRIKPILQFPGGEVELGYNVGTRTNGVDQARWPSDLMTEVVK